MSIRRFLEAVQYAYENGVKVWARSNEVGGWRKVLDARAAAIASALTSGHFPELEPRIERLYRAAERICGCVGNAWDDAKSGEMPRGVHDELMECEGEFRPALADLQRFAAVDDVAAPQTHDVAAETLEPPRTPVPVVLNGPGSTAVVNGKTKGPLTDSQYRAVKALLDAGEVGLTKDALESSGGGGARRTLKDLAKNDPDWAAVIRFPKKRGHGYRLGGVT